MFSIFINFCNDERKVEKVKPPFLIAVNHFFSEFPCVISIISLLKFCSNLEMNQKDDSSNSSIDDDAYLDEQEDPMTDQQSQNNQNLAGAVAGNTLPVKTSGNATRSVIDIIDGVAWSESLFNFIGLSDESQWVKFILISHRETSIFIFL